MASLSGFFYPWLLCHGALALHHPLDLPVFLAQLESERVQYTVAPPALLNTLLKQRELLAGRDLSALRIVASGSAPLAPWMVRTFQEEFGIDVVNVFGSNEGMSLCTSSRDVPDPEQRATLFPRFGVDGLAWSNPIAARIRTRLVDPGSGEAVTTPGIAGEMQIWGANVMDGYFESPEANAQAFSTDGWFRTGDLFEIAPEDPRFYRFTGRCKDIIIRGGMKISPEELDTVLAAHPQLAEAAVTGYPDEVLGERVCAVVVPKAGAQPTLADIVAFLEQQGVSKIKHPEKLAVVEALPRNPLGKLLRGELAAKVPA
jgi:acyl-CoA synthetase (AMP-forming)/AMP-acid ligase II